MLSTFLELLCIVVLLQCIAITVMIIIILSYNLITTIENQKDFKKFKAKQNETLLNMMKEREEN